MSHSPVESLVIEGTTKIVLLVLDGLGDIPSESHGWVTPLEAARTPNFDALAPRCAQGRILPVAPGITPGSGPGHLALFGYDPLETTVGRGVLEAIGAGFELQHGDVAARANFCTVDAAGIITDRRAGRIPTEECERLVGMLAAKVRRIEDVELLLKAGKGHRFVVVLRGPGLAGDVSDADPHKEGRRIPPATPLGADPGAAEDRAHRERLRRAGRGAAARGAAGQRRAPARALGAPGLPGLPRTLQAAGGGARRLPDVPRRRPARRHGRYCRWASAARRLRGGEAGVERPRLLLHPRQGHRPGGRGRRLRRQGRHHRGGGRRPCPRCWR